MAATVDAHVTVKQHGFHVKHPLAGEAAAASGSERREEGGAGAARGLLSFAPPPCAAAPSSGPPSAGYLQPADYAHLTPGVKRLMKGVVRGLKAFQEPEAASEGLGGTYFFTNDAGQKIAIMKPCDEEPLAPNNPKGFVGRQLGEPGLKPTVRVGEAASREVRRCWLESNRGARQQLPQLAGSSAVLCACQPILLRSCCCTGVVSARLCASPPPLPPAHPPPTHQPSRLRRTCWTTSALRACPTP